MSEERKVTPESVGKEFAKGVGFNSQIDLYETVKANENFFIGRQWEGVKTNGLPTPVFNFIKRVVMYLVASTSTDNLKVSASPLASTGMGSVEDIEHLCRVVNAQFAAVFEQNKVSKRIREFMRNAAVDGDGCIYTWFDPDVETGQMAKGAIRTEILENTRVMFGNPNRADVQSQPYILVTRREDVDAVKERAEEYGGDTERIKADTDDNNDKFDTIAGDKVTLVTRFWRDKKTHTIHAMECTRDAIVRPEWDTGMKKYPIVWMPWDYVQNCYHGQAAVTGLIPNQIFVNKAYAMSMISLMTTAYPKVVYDKTRVAGWSNAVGQAIGVNGGDVSTVAKTIDPATISPQISQFIESAINYTKEFMGATDAALGDTRPDNTSAIIALQKASSVPLEIVRQNLWQCVEDLANLWLDMMRVYYGNRYVELPALANPEPMPTSIPAGMEAPAMEEYVSGAGPVMFDFSTLGDHPLSLKLDVGGSAYWSEIAQMQTLDNLLMNGQIDIVDYLERVPNGYIIKQQELIEKMKGRVDNNGTKPPTEEITPTPETEVVGGPGYGALQRKINETGEIKV
jgi:hypothetical protein